jgi:hypothetical protein
VLLDGQGEVEAAKVAYQQAIDTGHPEVAPPAMRNLDDNAAARLGL